METFLKLFEEKKLSTFDLSFLQNWLHKKQKGRYARADGQARKLAILYSNRLGEKLYTTTAPMLGLLQLGKHGELVQRRSVTSTTSELIVGLLILQLPVNHDHYRMEWMVPE